MKDKNRIGQIGLSWLLGLGATVLLAAFGSYGAADRTSQARDYEQAQRISSLEARVERIPYIESKVDLLLERSGVTEKELKQIKK